MNAGCESSDLTSPREPYGRLQDMARRGKHGNRETDRDRQIGKAVANGSPRTNMESNGLTAYLKQRPACLKLLPCVATASSSTDDYAQQNACMHV